MAKQNPYVIRCDDGYAVRFVRRSYTVLTWIQDLTSRKMKSDLVNRPMVVYASRREAEQEIVDVVIPHLLTEKGVESDEITGW